MAQFLNIYKEANLYLEKYLAQLSKDSFLRIVRSVQMLVTVAFDEDVTDISDSA